jgi:hypothetical protein
MKEIKKVPKVSKVSKVPKVEGCEERSNHRFIPHQIKDLEGVFSEIEIKKMIEQNGNR